MCDLKMNNIDKLLMLISYCYYSKNPFLFMILKKVETVKMKVLTFKKEW